MSAWFSSAIRRRNEAGASPGVFGLTFRFLNRRRGASRSACSSSDRSSSNRSWVPTTSTLSRFRFAISSLFASTSSDSHVRLRSVVDGEGEELGLVVPDQGGEQERVLVDLLQRKRSVADRGSLFLCLRNESVRSTGSRRIVIVVTSSPSSSTATKGKCPQKTRIRARRDAGRPVRYSSSMLALSMSASRLLPGVDLVPLEVGHDVLSQRPAGGLHHVDEEELLIVSAHPARK